MAIVGGQHVGLTRLFNGRPYFARVPAAMHDGDRRVREAALKDLATRLRDAGSTLWEYWSPEILAAVKRLHEFDREGAEAAAFRAQLDAFLAEYGDRAGIGYGSRAGMRAPTWREDPALVLACLAPYLDPEAESPEVARARTQAERITRFAALCAACTDRA